MGEPVSGYTSKSGDKGNATWSGSKASIFKESLTDTAICSLYIIAQYMKQLLPIKLYDYLSDLIYTMLLPRQHHGKAATLVTGKIVL